MKSDTGIVSYLVGDLVKSNPRKEASCPEDDHRNEDLCM